MSIGLDGESYRGSETEEDRGGLHRECMYVCVEVDMRECDEKRSVRKETMEARLRDSRTCWIKAKRKTRARNYNPPLSTVPTNGSNQVPQYRVDSKLSRDLKRGARQMRRARAQKKRLAGVYLLKPVTNNTGEQATATTVCKCKFK